jgi:hypothetical protein
VLRSNSRFYYRQAFEYSKDSSSFFIRKLAFLAAGFKKSTIGNEKNHVRRRRNAYGRTQVTRRYGFPGTVSLVSARHFYTSDRAWRKTGAN